MNRKPLPHRDILRAILDYDPNTGKFTWKRRGVDFFKDGKQTAQHNCNIWNAKFAGKEALSTVDTKGYLFGPVLGVAYRAHRIAYAWMTGGDVDGEIDHINGNRKDNRFVNLRIVDSAQNGQNKRMLSANTSGTTGVFWLKRERKWMARITHRKNIHCLGYFINKDDAIAARRAGEVRFGFHENHGRAGR